MAIKKWFKEHWQEIASVGLLAGLIIAPLSMAKYSRMGRMPSYADVDRDVSRDRTAPYNDASGVKRIQRSDCYQRESVGECMARLVQSEVGNFYLWLIIFGGLQTFVAVLTWVVLRKQNDTVERLERPLVLPIFPIGFVDYRESINKSIFPVIDVNFENYGRSPALVDCCHIAVVIGLREPERRNRGDGFFSTFTQGTPSETKRAGGTTYHTGFSNIGYTRMVHSNASIGPGDRLGSFDVKETDLDAQQIIDIASGAQTVWLDCILLYSDVWGNKRETRFRWRYDLQMDIFIRGGSPQANGYT